MENRREEKQMENRTAVIDAKGIQALGFSRSMAYQFLNRVDMPVVKIGHRKYLHRELFERWLEEQANHEPAV